MHCQLILVRRCSEQQ
uniref:Uncharacterized protein n=1 Tax=Anguilla anguilla TaxID=7936 RepID=A0A0E9Q484_ANGAN